MATSFNVTLDDFDPPLVYANQADWTTPDPSANPARFNETGDASDGWFQGTYHSTTVEGSSLEIRGTSTPTSSAAANHTVTLTSVADGSTPSYTSGAAQDGVLFSASGLELGREYNVVLANGGGNLTLDEVVYAAPAGAEGATLTRTYLDETSPEITYSGAWESNTNPLFWGGSTTYTNADNAFFTFSFTGSLVQIYGDQVNDHGAFQVSVNGTPLAYTLSGASGCGGAFGKTCEKLGTLAWVGAGLGEGTHEVTVANVAGANATYFDLDYITYLTPASYYVPSSSSSALPSSSASSPASSAAPSASAAPQSGAFARADSNAAGGALGLAALALWGARVVGLL